VAPSATNRRDALARVRQVAATDENLTPATIELATAGGTVGEWAGVLREVFGEYRAPTGVGAWRRRRSRRW
jgi:(2R)-ethylmalonyl-CoA mutase